MLNFGIKLTLDGKEYTANLRSAEDQTKQFGNSAKSSAETATNQFAVATRGAKVLSDQLSESQKYIQAWAKNLNGLGLNASGVDLLLGKLQQRNATANADQAAGYRLVKAEISDLARYREREAAASRASAAAILSEAAAVRQLGQATAQLNSGGVTVKLIDAPAVEAVRNALAGANAETSKAAGNTMLLERAQARLNGQLAQGKISVGQHTAATARLNAEYGNAGNQARNAASGNDRLAESIKTVAHYATGLAILNQAANYARQALVMAEGYTQLQSRLRLVTDTSGEFVAAQADILRISSASGVPLMETMQLYARMSPVLKEVGFNQKQVAGLSEIVAKTLKLSGAGAQESASTMLQFSQAMGSGVLRGDEFNSLMENSPVLMRKLAEGMNVPIGQLRKMAETGALTASQVAESLLKMKDSIDRDFAKLPQTVSQAWTRMQNDIQVALGELNNSSQTTQVLANGLEFVRKNLDTVGTAAAIMGTGLAAVATGAALMTPVGAVIGAAVVSTLALAAAIAKLKGNEDERSKAARLAREEDVKSTQVFNEINAAILKLSKADAPKATIEGLRKLREELRNGETDSKKAQAALQSVFEGVKVDEGKLTAAKTYFKQFLPDAEKVKTGLAEMEQKYAVLAANGLANESAHQAAITEIRQSAYKNQIKLEEDLQKGAYARELTAEQQKIAALIEIEKKRITEAGGIKELELAAQRDTIAAIQVMKLEENRKELEGAQKLAADKLNILHGQLASSEKAETDYANKILGIKDAILGITQDTEDKKRAIARTAMNSVQAAADLQAQVNEKLQKSNDLLAKGEDEKAVAAAKQAEQLAAGLASTDRQIEAVDKAGEIYKKAEEKKLAATIRLAEEQKQQSEAYKTQIADQEKSMLSLKEKIEAVDKLLANPRTINISTESANLALEATRKKMGEIAADATRGFDLNIMTGTANSALDITIGKVDQLMKQIAVANKAAAAITVSGSVPVGYTDNGDGTMNAPNGETVVKMAAGGRLFGPGTPTSDSILMRGSVDEYMVKASSAKRVGYGVLDHINSMGELPRFADGGRIGGQQADPVSAAAGTINIDKIILPGVSNAVQLVAELRQMLRTDPNLLTVGSRAG